MKKIYLITLIMIFIIICLSSCFQNSYAEQENVNVIYSYSTTNKTKEEINKEWTSNDDRYWLLKGKIDGQSEVNYFAWTNVNRDYFKENTGLDLGSKLEIEIEQPDIVLNQYSDIRLKFNYIISTGDLNILDLNSAGIYVLTKNIQTNEEKWYGPYKLQEYSFISLLNRVQNQDNILEEEYECVSENLAKSIPQENLITKIKMIPYDDIEYDMETKNCYMGLFRMNRLEVVGYKNGKNFEGQQNKKIDVNVEELRKKIANNMYKLATIKWTPSEDIVTEVPAYVGTDSEPRYEKGKVYYGLPYAQNIDTTLEAFASQLNNGVYVGPYTKEEVYAVECCSSIWEGLSRYIPVVAGKLNYGPRKFFTHKEIQMLGGLTYNDENKFSTEAIKEKYGEQEIYNAYAQLKIGDMIFTNPKGTHVRMITGNTVVKYNSNNEIVPEESYVITSEISGRNPNDTYDLKIEDTANEMDGTLSEYTDLQTVQELSGKYTQWKINKKYTFSELYNNKLGNQTQMYIPVTLKSYILGQVDAPNVILINENTNDDILSGLKGSIYSNYMIESVNYYIINKTKNVEKNIKIYPNSTNTFSLYYETNDEIQNFIKEMQNSEYEITVSVTSAEQENVVLQLDNEDKEAPRLEVNYSTTLKTNKNVIAIIISNEEVQEVVGWNLSEDKKTLTKEYENNVREKLTIYDLHGNMSQIDIDISNIDKIAPEVIVEYSITEKTNQNVIVNIEANEKIQEVEGWILLEDGNTLSKIFTINSEEVVVIKDLAGNETRTLIKVENIDKIDLKYEVTYSTTLKTNKNVIVIISANKEIKEVAGWTLSENRKELTKEYKRNVNEEIIIYDLAGNNEKICINVTNIDKTPPEVIVKYSIVEKTSQNVIVSIEANEKLQQLEGWVLSDNQQILSKTYTKNINENITIYDIAGNSQNVKLEITNIENNIQNDSTIAPSVIPQTGQEVIIVILIIIFSICSIVLAAKIKVNKEIKK